MKCNCLHLPSLICLSESYRMKKYVHLFFIASMLLSCHAVWAMEEKTKVLILKNEYTFYEHINNLTIFFPSDDYEKKLVNQDNLSHELLSNTDYIFLPNKDLLSTLMPYLSKTSPDKKYTLILDKPTKADLDLIQQLPKNIYPIRLEILNSPYSKCNNLAVIKYNIEKWYTTYAYGNAGTSDLKIAINGVKFLTDLAQDKRDFETNYFKHNQQNQQQQNIQNTQAYEALAIRDDNITSVELGLTQYFLPINNSSIPLKNISNLSESDLKAVNLIYITQNNLLKDILEKITNSLNNSTSLQMQSNITIILHEPPQEIFDNLVIPQNIEFIILKSNLHYFNSILNIPEITYVKNTYSNSYQHINPDGSLSTYDDLISAGNGVKQDYKRIKEQHNKVITTKILYKNKVISAVKIASFCGIGIASLYLVILRPDIINRFIDKCMQFIHLSTANIKAHY
jgi:hypothetical protein